MFFWICRFLLYSCNQKYVFIPLIACIIGFRHRFHVFNRIFHRITMFKILNAFIERIAGGTFNGTIWGMIHEIKFIWVSVPWLWIIYLMVAWYMITAASIMSCSDNETGLYSMMALRTSGTNEEYNSCLITLPYWTPYSNQKRC